MKREYTTEQLEKMLHSEKCLNAQQDYVATKTEAIWNELTNGKRIPKNADILLRFEDGSIRRYDEELPELLVTHWMEIPKLRKQALWKEK